MSKGIQKYDDLFLYNNDKIIITHQHYLLLAEGFKSVILQLAPIQATPIEAIFIIEKLHNHTHHILFGDIIILKHQLSGKYLSNYVYENQIMIKLTNHKQQNCHFIIKPLFKVQQNFNKKIRHGEEISLENIQKFKFYIQIMSKENSCLMKKHEKSIIMLEKTNFSTEDQLNSHMIYQIANTETHELLHQRNSVFFFQKDINQYNSYLIICPVNQKHSLRQKMIEFNQIFYIQFLHSKQYLMFRHRNAQPVVEPNSYCQFMFQFYNQQTIRQNTTLKIKHISTQLYLSLSNNSVHICPFQLMNTFHIQSVQIEKLRTTTLINQFYISLTQIFDKDHEAIISSEYQILKISKEILKLLYTSASCYQKYSEMSNLNIKITSHEQILFAKVGFISLLTTILHFYLFKFNLANHLSNSKVYQIITLVMMLVTAICHSNLENIKIFFNHISFYCQHLCKAPGIIQCLYHLLSSHRDVPYLLQQSNHNKILPIDIIINSISKSLSFSLHMRSKLLLLLQNLVLAKNKQKLLLHQNHLFIAIRQKKFENLLYSMHTNNEDELILEINFVKQEFQQLTRNKNKYLAELEVVKSQLHFLCSLCAGAKNQNFMYFRQIISQDCLLNYFKSNLATEYRIILIRILLQIYLDSIIQNYSQHIIFLVSPEKYENNAGGDRRTILEGVQRWIFPTNIKKIHLIKQLILENTKRSLKNQIIQQSLPTYIQALKKFNQSCLLDQQEFQQLEIILHQFIEKNYKKGFTELQAKNILIQILKLYISWVKIKTKQFSEQLLRILNQKLPNLSISQQQASIIQVFQIFLQNKVRPFNQLQNFKFLQIIIQQCLQLTHQQQIFTVASELYSILQDQQINILQSLTHILLIGNQEQYNLFLQISHNKHQLITHLTQLNSTSQIQINRIKTVLNKVFTDMTVLLYHKSEKDQKKTSHFIQNLIREFYIIEPLLQFISQQSNFDHPLKQAIYSQIFQFLFLLLDRNSTNILKFSSLFTQFRSSIAHSDHGQIKILYTLILQEQSRVYLDFELKETTLLAIQKSSTPNVGTLLCLNILLREIGSIAVNSSFLQSFTQNVLNSQTLFEKIWKIKQIGNSYQFIYQDYDKSLPNYNQYFTHYIFLVVRCFLVLIQNSSQRKPLVLLFKSKISFQIFIEMFTFSDIIKESNKIQGSLLKIELLTLYRYLYQEDISTISFKQSESLIDKLFYINKNLFECLTEDRSKMEQQIQADFFNIKSQSNNITLQCLKIALNSNNLSIISSKASKYFSSNYLIIVVTHPFILELCNALSSTSQINSSHRLLTQLSQIISYSYRKMKEYLTNKLKLDGYKKYAQDYHRAIANSEEIIKMKYHFYPQSQIEQSYVKSKPILKPQIYINRRISNIVNLYKQQKQIEPDSKTVNLYYAIIFVMYCPTISNLLKKKLQIVLNNSESLFNLLSLIKKMPRDAQPFSNSQKLKLFLLYAQNSPFLIEFLHKQQYNSFHKFIAQLVDPNYQPKQNLKQYVITANRLFTPLINSTLAISSNILQDIYPPNKKQIIMQNRLFFILQLKEIIVIQKKYYLNNQFNKILQWLTQHHPINLQGHTNQLNLLDVLNFLSNKLTVNDSQCREIWTDLIYEIVQLLKIYTNYLKKFNYRYITQDLSVKIILCCQILSRAISMNNKHFINLLIKEKIWTVINQLINIKDNQANKQITIQQLITSIISNIYDDQAKQFMINVNNIINHSRKFYGQWIIKQPIHFPLLPLNSHHHKLKQAVIMILTQFKLADSQLSMVFFQNLNTNFIKQNINHNYEIIHQNNYQNDIYLTLENGINFLSVLIYANSLHSNQTLEQSYQKFRINNSRRSPFIEQIFVLFELLVNFISFLMSIYHSFNKHHINNLQQISQTKIYEYFYAQMGRVQLLINKKLYSCDFIIYPQCKTVSKRRKNNFLKNINFISTQLKYESIIKACKKFHLIFQQQQNFQNICNKLPLIYFINKNLKTLRICSLILVCMDNFYLLYESNNIQQEYYTTFDITHTFQIITVVHLILYTIYFIVYCMKQIPILVAIKSNYIQEQYPQFFTYNPIRKLFVLTRNVFLNKHLLYNLIYLILLALTFVNKLVISILILDLIVQIPAMRKLLDTIWRPRFQIILTFLSFLLIHYFFAIISYVMFFKQSKQVCPSFGACFAFIFNLVFKTIGGFVGFLYKQKQQIGLSASLNVYQIFADIYIIITYQIFASVIIVLIIDSYSRVRSQTSNTIQKLESSCLVCNLDRVVFNSNSKFNFKDHISINHNIWNYLNYYHYLSKKTIQTRSYHERLVYLNFGPEWLPNNFAIGLQQPQ